AESGVAIARLINRNRICFLIVAFLFMSVSTQENTYVVPFGTQGWTALCRRIALSHPSVAAAGGLHTVGRHSREFNLDLHFILHTNSEIARGLDAESIERNRKASTHAHSTITLLNLHISDSVDRVLLTVQRELRMEPYRGPFNALHSDLLKPCCCRCA